MLHVINQTNNDLRSGSHVLLKNRHLNRFLEHIHENQQERPKSTVELLSNPTGFTDCINELNNDHCRNDFIEQLIATNILNDTDNNQRPTQARFTNFINACNVRALYISLSKEHKEKFFKILKALDIAFKKNPELKEKMTRLFFEGGAKRVVASIGGTMVANAILLLHKIKPKDFFGVSAGGFLALAEAVKAPNSAIFNTGINTNFGNFYQSRENLISWLTGIAKEGYRFNTGREIETLTEAHLKDLDTKLHVLVSEGIKGNAAFGLKSHTYFLPHAFENRFGDTKQYDLLHAVAASANLPGLFFSDFDSTFGDCYYQDPAGNKRHLLDGGYFFEDSIPLKDYEREIHGFAKDSANNEQAPFNFIFSTKPFKAPRSKRLKLDYQERENELRALNGLTGIKGLIFNLRDTVMNWYDTLHYSPVEIVSGLGLNRTNIQARCVTRNPEHGLFQHLQTLYLKDNKGLKADIIRSNIPTYEFAESQFKEIMEPLENSSIDQLYNNLVDEEYINSNGESGKSPFDLNTESILSASQNIDTAFYKENAAFIARLKIKKPATLENAAGFESITS